LEKSSNNSKNLTIITTHVNADFDALSSMLAAQKLYPGSLIVFPGSYEKNLRNFFVKSMVYLFNIVHINDIDFDSVQRLVIVDTRHSSRIGKFISLLKKPGLSIHIYDHHPDMPDNIKGDYEVIEKAGANVTILIKILEEKKIKLSPNEATIMCLGIYEDTGFFTFPSTTEDDFKAASLMLSKGADLNIVSSLIDREMTPVQVGLLSEMIQSVTNYNINGIEVVLTTVSAENYVPDFAFLATKMLKMGHHNVIFSIARMGKKIYIVARSKINEVDVGAIVSLFGGGGHAFAASATINGKTLAQVEHKLIEILYSKIQSVQRAKDLMSFPPISIEPEALCEDAGRLFTRYNLNALLVIERQSNACEKGRLTGYITRQIVEKALFHKLDHVKVKEYMEIELGIVKPDADLLEIQEKIIHNKQRILPVVDEKNIIGVITRTDLLNVLYRHPLNNTKLHKSSYVKINARTRNIFKFMSERLPENIIGILKKIGGVADELGYNAYVVGGFVRDLFLYRDNEDIDIVVEGDGIEFARKYANIMGTRVHYHEKFGTAVIIFPDGFKIDVASARLEYYNFPAALPEIEKSSIKLDLFRRDFTINTLAVQLNYDSFGTLIDFFAAQKDIKAKVIRVLHNLSFVEDPTRAFRAIKFEQRFGFSNGKLTSSLIKNAVNMDFFKRLSGKRIFIELRQILEEENPAPAIIRLNDYNLLEVIHASIVLTVDLISLFNSTRKVLAWYDLLFIEDSYLRWIVYFMVLTRNCDIQISEDICIRFALSKRFRTIICKERYKADKCLVWIERQRFINNDTAYKLLRGFKTEAILYLMASTKHKNIKKMISHYFIQLRNVSISITGKDLKKIGLKPGPFYKEIMDAVLSAKLNGIVKTRSDELKFINDYIM